MKVALFVILSMSTDQESKDSSLDDPAKLPVNEPSSPNLIKSSSDEQKKQDAGLSSSKELGRNGANSLQVPEDTKQHRDEKTERRMEMNRIRAKEIRKRKKQMEVDMQQQIIRLTLENSQLRSQIKMQDAEIKNLRNAFNPGFPSVSEINPNSASFNRSLFLTFSQLCISSFSGNGCSWSS